MKTSSFACLLTGVVLCFVALPTHAQVLAQYGFENNVVDTSGNGHNGTAVNVTYTAGVVGASSGTFNGTSSYVDLGDNTPTSTLKPTLPVTVTAWVCLGNTNACRIFSGDNLDNSTTDSMMAG